MLRATDKKATDKYIVLTLSFKQENDVWLAWCQELGTSTFGDTFEEAREALREAIGLHLNTLEDFDECERFLKDNGVKVYKKQPTPDAIAGKVSVVPGILISRDIARIPRFAPC